MFVIECGQAGNYIHFVCDVSMINCNKSQTFSTLNRNSGQNLIDLKKKFGNSSTVVAAGLNLLLGIEPEYNSLATSWGMSHPLLRWLSCTHWCRIVICKPLPIWTWLQSHQVRPQLFEVGPHLATCAITMQLKVVFQKLMVWHAQTATLRILHSQLNNQVVGVITCNLSLTVEQIQWSHEATTDFS